MKRVMLLVALMTLLVAAGVGHAQEPEPIRIGINMELTGYSSDQGMQQYMGALIGHTLQPNVTVDGVTYPIEFVLCDNRTLREESASCASRLISQGVVGVLGGFSSSMSLAAAPVMQAAGVVQISTGSTNPATTRVGDAIFRIPFTDDYQGQAIAAYAYDVLGARQIVIFQQADDDYSTGITPVIEAEFRRLGGTVSILSFDQSITNFSDLLSQARLRNPDALVTTAFCQFAGPLMKQSRSMGFEQPWLGGDSLDSSTCAELGGEAFEGVVFTAFPDLTQLEPEATERAAEAVALYAQLFPNSAGFGGITLAGTDAYSVLREAIRLALAEGADPARLAAFRGEVRSQLARIEGYPGVTGTLTYLGTDGTPASRGIGLFEVQGVEASGRFERVPAGFFTIEADGAVYHSLDD